MYGNALKPRGKRKFSYIASFHDGDKTYHVVVEGRDHQNAIYAARRFLEPGQPAHGMRYGHVGRLWKTKPKDAALLAAYATFKMSEAM